MRRNLSIKTCPTKIKIIVIFLTEMFVFFTAKSHRVLTLHRRSRNDLSLHIRFHVRVFYFVSFTAVSYTHLGKRRVSGTGPLPQRDGYRLCGRSAQPVSYTDLSAGTRQLRLPPPPSRNRGISVCIRRIRPSVPAAEKLDSGGPGEEASDSGGTAEAAPGGNQSTLSV